MNRFAQWLAGVQALFLATLGGMGAEAQTPGSADDEAAWRQARSVGSAEAYRQYLELHPVGSHASEAFRSLIELTVAAEPGVIAVPAAGAGITRSLAVDMY